MNLKKILQKQAEEDAEVLLTEEDKLFIQQLVQENDENERQDKDLSLTMKTTINHTTK